MGLLPQIGMFELMLLAAVALVVVGPKDLPRLMHGLGKFVAQLQGLAAEFRGAFDQMAREAELEEVRKEIEELKKHNPMTEVRDALNDVKDIDKDFDDLDYQPPVQHVEPRIKPEGEAE